MFAVKGVTVMRRLNRGECCVPLVIRDRCFTLKLNGGSVDARLPLPVVDSCSQNIAYPFRCFVVQNVCKQFERRGGAGKRLPFAAQADLKRTCQPSGRSLDTRYLQPGSPARFCAQQSLQR
jgi:hypothetical protein